MVVGGLPPRDNLLGPLKAEQPGERSLLQTFLSPQATTGCLPPDESTGAVILVQTGQREKKYAEEVLPRKQR